MSAPPLLILAALLLWGWQSQLPWLGLLLGLTLESLRFLPWRWQASLDIIKQWFVRALWLSVFLCVALVIFLLASHEPGSSSMPLVQWLPLAFLPPILVLQATGLHSIDSSFIPQTWKAQTSASHEKRVRRPINLLYPWLGLWLLAAGTANNQGAAFYWLFCLCAAWALWQARPPQRALRAWFLTLGCAVLLGAAIHLGLYRMQGLVEEWAMSWLANRAQDDPIQSQTALGHIGELKLSDQISLQVVPYQNGQPQNEINARQLLLMSASYNIYQNTSWKLTGNNSFIDVQQNVLPTRRSWNLRSSQAAQAAGPVQEIEITAYSEQHHGLIQLPLGASQVSALNRHDTLTRLSRNPMGSVQGFMSPGYFRYQARFSTMPPLASEAEKPGPKDLQLPPQERALLLQVVQQLKLSQQSPQQQLATLQDYFARNFRYSTWRSGNTIGKSALADFLTQSKSGHCEHFATASALLLRASGLPARYAVGYSVQEKNPFGAGYLVRQRHAHAWVRVYVNQRWQDFDSTPANWLELEQSSPWEWLQTARFWLTQQWLQWEISKAEWAIVLTLLCASLVLSRMLRAKGGRWQGLQRMRRQTGGNAQADLGALGQIVQRLSQAGLGRQTQEPLQHWQARIGPHMQADAAQQLAHVITLYYLARFGPPQQASQDSAWQQASQTWLANWPQTSFTTLDQRKPDADPAPRL